MKITNILASLAVGIAMISLSACGTSQKTTKQPISSTNETKGSEIKSLAFVQKVANKKVTAQNIVGKMSLTMKMGTKDITVPGSLHMRYGEVIRIQAFIPLLGSEVGRIEFTPDYVLVVDRMHKEYIKAAYNQVDFLKSNGLNFYALQALFWNQLFVPGTKSLSDAELADFKVADATSGKTITLSKGNLSFAWNADANTAQISTAKATYNSVAHGNSTLNWTYSNFKQIEGKTFPAYQKFTFATTSIKNQQNISLTLDMDGVKNDSKWDAKTIVSTKYKKIEATDIFGKLLNTK